MKITTNYLLKLTDPEDIEEFNLFQKLGIKWGKGVDETIMSMIRRYNVFNSVSYTLISERELIEKLEKQDSIKITRATLRRYRAENKLETPMGAQLSFTDGSNVIYNYEGVRDFLLEYRDKPYSRLRK